MSTRLLSNRELRDRLKQLAADERKSLAGLLVHLAEANSRRACHEWGYPSLFFYCTEELRYSEAAAYKRITAARAAADYPAIPPLVEAGELNLASLLLLVPHLTADNHAELLDRARRKTRREVEELVSAIAPKPDRPDFARTASAPLIIPCPSPDASLALQQPAAPSPQAPTDNAAQPASHPNRPRVEILSPGRVHFGGTIAAEVWAKIERVKGLLRHKHPGGRLDDILNEMAEAFLEAKDPIRRAERRKARGTDFGRPVHGRSPAGRRTFTRALRDHVIARDGGRCTFAPEGGGRCRATAELEVDHIVPRAKGGNDDPANLRTLCRAHNQHAARLEFGMELVGPHRRRWISEPGRDQRH